MSCNCIGNFYTDSNGNQQPLTEFMCFEIIAQNSFCCDTFDKSCLNTIYFDSTAENYVGCYGCPSENSNCCYLIQSEANKINPNANSQCCENFDSYCAEAYETLKNTKGNFCSDVSSLKDYYVNTYSTDYRPCNFTDEQADQCIAELNCSQFNSEQCIDSLYSKLTNFSSACQCTCFKQASFLSTCMLNVIHKEPTCCHSWTAECEYIKNELEKIPNGPCSKVVSESDGSLAGLDPPGTLSCGCIAQNVGWSAMPCDVFNFFCSLGSGLPYNCITQNVGEIISDYMQTLTNGLCNDIPLNIQACSPVCPDLNCLDCYNQGYSIEIYGTPWYDVLINCDACAWAIVSVVFPSIASSTNCADIEEAIRIVRISARIIKAGPGGSVTAGNCSECCALCRFLGQVADACTSCTDGLPFIVEETPDANGNDLLVYEGQGITFTTDGPPWATEYLFYELNPQNGSNFNQQDLGNMGLGANNKPLGMTGIVEVPGNSISVHIKIATDGAIEGSEYFRFIASELVDLDKCPYGVASSGIVEVKEQVTYTLSGVPANCQVNEGDTLTLRITTTNAPTGTIYYKITPIVGAQASDFGITLQGSNQIINSIMTLNIPIVADSSTENQEERFKVEFSRTSDFATIIASTDTACTNGITIIDSSQDELDVNVFLNGSNSDSVVEEGGIATFRVESNQNRDLYYTINTNGTNFSTADLDSNINPPADTEFQDLFTVTNNFTNIYKKVKADFTSETPESFKLEVRTNSTQGPIVATSPTAFVSDSSGAPVYTISGPSEVFEGSSYGYNIVTTNSPYSTLWYRIVAVGASEITVDDFSIPLSGSFTLSSGSYTLTLPVATDIELENSEQFRIEIWPSNNFSNVANRLTRTNIITLQDTTQDVSISQTTNILQEGQSVTFTVNTVNISDTQLSYEIIPTYGNIEASDFTSGSLTGSFTLTDIGSSKTGQFTLSLVNNLSYEGEERFVVNIYDSVSQLLITSSPETVVTDADPTYGITPSTTLITEGNSFTVTVTTTNYPNANVYYRIEQVFGSNPIDASDFEDGLEGAIPITSSSVVHTITSIEKSVSSGFRGFRVIISDSYNGIERASTAAITLKDTNPTFEIQVPEFVVEGESFDFTVNTTNLPENTTLYYKINGLSASDIVGGLTGSFIVTGNTKTVTIQTANNSAYEGAESFTIQIFDNVSLTPPAKVESTSITLLDGVPVYGPLSPNSGTIVEGATQVFTFATTNLAPGTILYYDIIPESGDLNANDFSPATLSGSFTVGSSFSITTVNNPEFESNESFKIQISSNSGPEYISQLFILKDGISKYVISADKYSVQEGDDITFTVNTENVADGTNLIYYLSGSVNKFDFEPEGITGPVVINSNYYQFILGISADLSSEGTESFTAVIKQNDAGLNLSDPTATITISDTSTSFFTITPDSGSITEGQSQTFTVTRTGAGTDGTFYYGITGINGGQEINETDFIDGLTGEFTISSGVGTFTITTVTDPEISNRQFVVKIGTTNDPYNSVITETNLFNILDVNPEYQLTQSKDTIVEGFEGVTFTIQTSNVPAGTQITYQIEAISGNITSTDFIDGTLSGSITIDASGIATLYKAATNDCQHETPSGPEQFQIVFSKDSKPVAYSTIINIIDPAPAFTSIQPFGCINGCGCEEGKVTEGTNVTFTVTGCNIPNSFGQYRALLQKYPFTTGFDASDVTPSIQNLTFNNNTATFNVFINNTGSNTLYEDGDRFVVKIRPAGAGNDLISSGCFTIINAAPTGTVTPSVSSVAEGDQITFNIIAQNVPNNSSIQYEIIGLSEEDLVDGQLSGNITVTASGNEYVGSVTKRISTDSVFGEVESLVFVIYYNTIELNRTSEIPIVDTTPPTVPTYTLTISDRTVGPGQSFIATLATTDVPLGTEFEFRIKGLYGYLPNPDDFIPSEIIRTAVLPKNNKIVLNYKIFEEVENNFSFNIQVYRVLTGLVSDYELVALSDPISSQIADDGCQGGPVSGTYGEQESLCSVCDNACGYVSFWGTADAFVGYRSEPLRQATSTAICDTFPEGECPTEDCPNYGSPCELCLPSETFDCACKTSEQNSVSYARFTNKQFITVFENGVYKNRKMEESELIAYRNSEIRVPVYQIQGHDNLCPPAPTVCGIPYDSGAGMNVSCVAGYGGGYNSCYQYQSDTSWNGLSPDYQTFFETGPMWTTTFSSGINAIRKSYGDAPLFGNDYGCVRSVILPAVVPIGPKIDDDLFANYRCANQNYLLGAPNPPEGITAAFIADHLNESFTQQLCDLIHTCSRANEGEICQTYFLANCKEQMDSPCLTRAERYAIINGCTGAYGFTLNNNFVYSSNRDDFVWFFQGIRAGNFTTTDPGNKFREENPIIDGTTDIRRKNQCFTYYPANIDPNEKCLIIDFFADPIYYFGKLATQTIEYIPDQTGTCDATIEARNDILVPPQHTGCCYKKNENDSSVNATKQFRTISYFSKDSSLRPKVLDYLRSLDANFIVISAVDPGSVSAYDFYNGALCEFLMPRHPYFEGPPEGAAAGPYQGGNFEYAYGYKPAYGTEGTFYRINTCRKYDLYERANDLKRDDPTLTLITGYPNTRFSLEGELAECQGVGGGDVGSGIVSGVGFLGNDTTQSPTTLCLIDRGIKNPLTAWPATEEARDGRIHTSNAYVVQIIGHDGGLNNPKLPNNNAPKVFNACFPCRGFIDLPMQGDNPTEDAVFAEYAEIGDGIQRLIIKSYTKEGKYNGHSVGSILARMTLKDQIKQENIYYKDIAEYSLILIGSGIEILHTREVSQKEFYDVLQWDLNPTGITSSSNSRAEKLSLVYHTGVPLGLTFDVNDNRYNNAYWPFGLLNTWSVGEVYAFKDTGGYIGQQGQNVSAYVGREVDSPFFAERVNANTVHGIFENGSGQATRFITNSDRNAKVNNNIGILRVHKEYDMGGGHKIPNCREKFETLNRDLTNCDLPNNLVMNGMCWITTVIQKDIWEHSNIQDWVSNKELSDPDNTNLNVTTFEDWITTTRLAINFDEFILVLNSVISALKAEQSTVYIGTGALNSIPTPITEELYSMRRNNEYVYNMNDLKQAAIKSKNNSYSCFNPDGQSGAYNCSDYFCELFCPSSLEATEFTLINAFNGCDDSICNPNDPSITSNGKFISVPSNSCLQAMVTQLENTYFCSTTSKPFTAANIKKVIEIILENRSNPCVFQYNNKVYRIMKEA